MECCGRWAVFVVPEEVEGGHGCDGWRVSRWRASRWDGWKVRGVGEVCGW